MITYRKTRAGEWVAFGPVAEIQAGREVTVTKRSGQTKTELVDRIGKPFVVDGTKMVYGYIDTAARREIAQLARDDAQVRREDAARRRSVRRMCGECGERRAVTTATDLSGIVGNVCGVCARSGALSFA